MVLIVGNVRGVVRTVVVVVGIGVVVVVGVGRLVVGIGVVVVVVRLVVNVVLNVVAGVVLCRFYLTTTKLVILITTESWRSKQISQSALTKFLGVVA